MVAPSNNGNRQHLTLSDRIYIEQGLERQLAFKDIAAFIKKDATTISKEIRRHRLAKTQDRKTALCIHRGECTKTRVCNMHSSRFCGEKLCGKCTQRNCHIYCREYQPIVCKRLVRAALCLQWLRNKELSAKYKILLSSWICRSTIPSSFVRFT